MAANTSSAASNASASTVEIESLLKRNSNDIGWEYGIIIDPNNLDKLKCKLCGKACSGGIYRIKQHIAHIKGNVASCPKASDEDKTKCKAAICEAKLKKKTKLAIEKEVRDEVHIIDEEEDNDQIEIGSKRKRPHFLGPMDKFASPIDPNSSLDSSKKKRQQILHETLWNERTHSVHSFVARWVYESGIPFHAIDNDSFQRMVEAIGQFGPGYQRPSQYELREPLLKKEVERTKNSLKIHEEEWAKNGCSIMTDAWTDRKRRSIMNLCVNCNKGTTFLSSREDSEASHTGQYIFEYVDKCVEEVGSQNVVQVVTDNASNNMAAADLLVEKRPNMFWTSCAAHTLNLMLEGIGKTPKFKGVIDKAKSLTIFIYAHHKTLAMMRKYTKKRDIVRPGITRFATCFLTLQSLWEKRENLRTMMSTNAWEDCKWSKSSKGKMAYATVVSMTFWNGVRLCLDVFSPLVKLLRLVDGDRKSSMGFLYGELLEAKEEIKEVYKNVETNYGPILSIIDAKAKSRLDSPLHLTAYLLNPYYFFKKPNLQNDENIMEAMMTCVEKFFPDDFHVQNQVTNVELLKYKGKVGMFRKKLAAAGCVKNDESYDPVGWWSNYGNSTPNLQRMASRILSLTTSSSGCERNWSTFEGIHTKKRNRLDASRLNNLVYVQFNAKIINKTTREKEKREVLMASESSMAQGWIVDGGDDEEVEPGSGLTWGMVEEASEANMVLEPRRSERNVNVRELNDEDFISDDDTEEEGEEEEYEFESD